MFYIANLRTKRKSNYQKQDKAMDISKLYKEVKKRLSQERYNHTLGVEKMALRLGEIYLPEKLAELRCAALLHDIAKELSEVEQLELMRASSFSFTDEDFNTPSAYHSFAAPALLYREFPEFSTPDILSAVFNHTLGAYDMSLFDKIIFIADYIEEGRVYESCSRVREFLFASLNSGVNKLVALDRAICLSIENTRVSLISRGKQMNSRSIKLFNSLMSSF